MTDKAGMSLAEQVNGLWAWVDFKARDSFEDAVRKIAALEQRLAAAEQERDEARKYAEHLYGEVSGTSRKVSCAFCQQEYSDGTPATQDQALTKHIKICKNHPMRLAEKERDTALAQLAECQQSLEAARERIKELEARLNPPRRRPLHESIPEDEQCRKCGGDGWLWCHELENYRADPHDCNTDDTKYPCDKCKGTGRTEQPAKPGDED